MFDVNFTEDYHTSSLCEIELDAKVHRVNYVLRDNLPRAGARSGWLWLNRLFCSVVSLFRRCRRPDEVLIVFYLKTIVNETQQHVPREIPHHARFRLGHSPSQVETNYRRHLKTKF